MYKKIINVDPNKMFDPKVIKKNLRRMVLDQREKLSPSEVNEKSTVICDKLSLEIDFTWYKKVTIFMPIRNEVEVTKLVGNVNVPDDVEFYIPKIVDGKMDFYLYEGVTNTTKGVFNILEPNSNKALIADEHTVIIMPGSVFTKEGDRIGYGGGYYDRYLQNNDVLTMAVAYEFQVIEDFPEIAKQECDIKPHFIVTDENVYCGRLI